MKHRFSQPFLARRYRPPGFQAHRLLGGSIGALIFFATYLASGDNANFGSMLILAMVLLIAWTALKLARRFMPELLMRYAEFEVDGDGFWRTSAKGKELLMPRNQLKAVGVFRDSSGTIQQVTLVGRKYNVPVYGLVSMESFLMDLKISYPRAEIVHQEKWVN